MNKLGQNFLINRNIADKIVDLIKIKGKNIIEIGGGKGILTERIIQKLPEEILVFEIDEKLCECLKEKFGDRILLVCKDILSFSEFGEKEYTLISNLPYYISKEIIEWIIMNKQSIYNGVLMLQNDFVKKILSLQTPLSILFNTFFSLKIIFKVNKGSFTPMPKVLSVVFTFQREARTFFSESNMFYEFLKMGFRKKRKTLINNLSKHYDKEKILLFFKENNIDAKIRAQQLGKHNFIKLFQLLEKNI